METRPAFRTEAGKNEVLSVYDGFLQKWTVPIFIGWRK